MDFKSHEEVVLPPDEAAKKRAREAARKEQPPPSVREIRIPAGKKQVKAPLSSSSSGERAVPRVPIREVQLSADQSNVRSAAASLNPEDTSSVAVRSITVERSGEPSAPETPVEKAPVAAASPTREAPKPAASSTQENPAGKAPAETPAIEPRVLNAGMRLLNQASRRGTPGGRLVRSGQLARLKEQVEPTAQSRPEAETRQPTRAVKVESVGEMTFSKESVEEVATLQAPPPVEAHPQKPPQTKPPQVNPRPGFDSREPVDPSSSPVPEPIRIDTREFLKEMGIPVPEPVEEKATEHVDKIDPPQSEPIRVDSKKFTEEMDFLEPNPLKLSSEESIDVPEPEPAKLDSGGLEEMDFLEPNPLKLSSAEFEDVDFPEPDPLTLDSEESTDKLVLAEKETETIDVDPRELTKEGNLPKPEPVVVLELGQADLVWEPPDASPEDEDPEPAAKKPGQKAKRTSQKPYRDFIIAYDGVFIGHFRSKKRITNRTAFQQAARQLHSTTKSFDVRKLQLYRPVPVDVEIPDSITGISDGAFMWFADRRPHSQE